MNTCKRWVIKFSLLWNTSLTINTDVKLLASTRYLPKPLSWVDWLGNSVGVSTGVTATEFSREDIFLPNYSWRGHTWCALRLICGWGSSERIPARDGIRQWRNSSWFQGWVCNNPCFVRRWAVRDNGSCWLDTTTYGPSLFTTGQGRQSGRCFD